MTLLLQLDMKDYGKAMLNLQKSVGADVTTWTFGNLKRGEDGKFKDDDLARLLMDAYVSDSFNTCA